MSDGQAPTGYEVDMAVKRIERGDATGTDADLIRRYVEHLEDIIAYQAKQINALNGVRILKG